MDKSALLAELLQKLQRELEQAEERAKDAAEAATHPENRAEGDKDMRSTEASYLARGHSVRAAALELMVTQLGTLSLKRFSSGQSIDVTALVEVESGSKRAWYLLLPVAGGERIVFAGREVSVLSPQSPLGAALLGLEAGDEAEVSAPQGTPRVYRVLRVL